jgi:hypothetical protein
MFIILILLYLSTLATASSEQQQSGQQPGTIYPKDVIGWIVSFLAVIPPTIALWYTANTFRDDANSRYIQTFRETDKEISEFENQDARNANLGTEVRLIWESNFLNAMERIASLMLSTRYPKDMVTHYEND